MKTGAMQLRLIFLVKKTSEETISIQMKFYINLHIQGV